MMFMNSWEIEEAVHNHSGHPVLGPAVRTLNNLQHWADTHSDGWAYWPKPCRAAAKLQALIQDHDRWVRGEYQHPRPGAEATPVTLKAALAPIKAFRTRQHADFEIVTSAQEAVTGIETP